MLAFIFSVDERASPAHKFVSVLVLKNALKNYYHDLTEAQITFVKRLLFLLILSDVQGQSQLDDRVWKELVIMTCNLARTEFNESMSGNLHSNKLLNSILGVFCQK